jgi:nitrite reductase (NADH) small subunit
MPSAQLGLDLNTGQALGPDEGGIATFATRVEGGRVLIEAALLDRQAA